MTVKGSHISTHGYYIKRESIAENQIKQIKDELTVKPKTFDYIIAFEIIEHKPLQFLVVLFYHIFFLNS